MDYVFVRQKNVVLVACTQAQVMMIHTSFSEELSILTGLTRWRICKSVHNIFVFLLRVPFMLHARLLDVIHLVCSKKVVIIFWHRLFELNLSQGQPWFSFAFSHLQPEMAKLSEKRCIVV